MNNLINGYLQLLIFGTFIILVLGFEKRYFKYYPGVKASLVTGFSLLFTGACSSFFLPFFNLPITINSNLKAGMEIGLYLSGSILILQGLRKWVSHLSRGKKISIRRLKELACLKQLQSLSQDNQNLEKNLKDGFDKVMRYMGYKKGVLFHATFNSPEFFLFSHFNLTPEELQRFYTLNLNEGFYNDALKTREIVSINQFKDTDEWYKLFAGENEIASFACVPLRYANKSFGLLCIYDSEPERFVFEEIQFLTCLRDSFGLMIEQSLLMQKSRARKESLQTADQICSRILESKNLEEDLTYLAQNLKKVIEFDYISLSLVEGSGKNVKKLSLGLGENLLLDKNTNMPVYGTSIGWVLDSAEPMIENDITLKGYYEDNLSKIMGIRSKIIHPLKIKGKVIATLTLGSKNPHYYNSKSIKKVSLFPTLLTLYLQKKNLKDSLQEEKEYFRTFYTHLMEFLKWKDFKGYLHNLVEDLTRVLPVSFCRISFLDPDKRNLELLSGYKRREGIFFSTESSQPLEVLPWHRMTLETRKPMLINQDDPESMMSKEEASLFLAPNLKSAILLPLVQDGENLGVVALGEMRSWERRPFKRKEIDFLEKISRQISFARTESLSGDYPESSSVQELDQKISRLGLEVNNSLTSIIGSLELLNLKKNLTVDKTERYLKIIEKGALRIKENMESFFEQTDYRTINKSEENQNIFVK
ncbi:MAG: GAF domain-containing protein [candidate division Zixibacteria bacterium]|nr:GAF domain-containing protein [candidate division Zixibacteria bacterium]